MCRFEHAQQEFAEHQQQRTPAAVLGTVTDADKEAVRKMGEGLRAGRITGRATREELDAFLSEGNEAGGPVGARILYVMKDCAALLRVTERFAADPSAAADAGVFERRACTLVASNFLVQAPDTLSTPLACAS